MAILTHPLATAVEDVIERVSHQDSAVVVVLDQVGDPHNVGAIVRSAAALGASNIVVSVMLIVSSMLITTRRASAMWFVRQAILANLLFIAARFAVEVNYLWSLGAALDPIGRDAFERASGWLAPDQPAPNFTSLTRSSMLLGQLLAAGLSGSIHLYLGWKATRPGVREFIEEGPRRR